MISFSLHMVGKNDPACLVLPSALSASDAAHLCRLISQMVDMTDEKLTDMAQRMAWSHQKGSTPVHGDTYKFNAYTLRQFADALIAAERERAAMVCDDEARIREEAAAANGVGTPGFGRCMAAARAAANCAKGVRNGEVVETHLKRPVIPQPTRHGYI